MKKAWEKQEAHIAKSTGGRRNAASGALSQKSDVRAPGLLFEAKWTGKTQYTLKAAEVETNVREAIVTDRTPVFHIQLNGRNYWLLCEDDALAMWQAFHG